MYLKGEDSGTESGNISSNKRWQIILQCLGLLLKFIAMISLDLFDRITTLKGWELQQQTHCNHF